MCPSDFSFEEDNVERGRFRFESNSFIPSYRQAIFIFPTVSDELELLGSFTSAVGTESKLRLLRLLVASGRGRLDKRFEMSWPIIAIQPPSFLDQSAAAVATPSAKKHRTIAVQV